MTAEKTLREPLIALSPRGCGWGGKTRLCVAGLLNIRKFTGVAFANLDELVERDMLSVAAAAFLECVAARLSIALAGPPGSGKTTVLSCCAAELGQFSVRGCPRGRSRALSDVSDLE